MFASVNLLLFYYYYYHYHYYYYDYHISYIQVLKNWTYKKEVGAIDMGVLMRLDPLGTRPSTSTTNNNLTQRSAGTAESRKRGGTAESKKSAN